MGRSHSIGRIQADLREGQGATEHPKTWEPRNTRRPPKQGTAEYTEYTEVGDKWVRFPGVEF